jgi:hypothetical protein
MQQESAFSSLKLTRYQRLTGFAACKRLDPLVRALANAVGFVVGFGVSLLGAIMLFIGFTGAFASTSIEEARDKDPPLTLISSIWCWNHRLSCWNRVHCVRPCHDDLKRPLTGIADSNINSNLPSS